MTAKQIAAGVFCVPLRIANAYLVGNPGGRWSLVDAGLPGEGPKIRAAAASVFGAASRPEAILLTHGHPDHSGSALELSQHWNAPVLSHPLELAYLTGRSQYPPIDPTVGGFLALLGRFFQPSLVNLRDCVSELPRDCAGFGLAGWEWVHTPGHSPGHVAFFRRADGTLLAGDAITTMNLNSLFASASQVPQVCGPPPTATYDWTAAGESVNRLAALQPLTLACGHGRPMSGGPAVRQLAELATNFPTPATGRYLREPAVVDENGVVSLPPKPADPFPGTALGIGIVAAGSLLAMAALRRKTQKLQTPGGDTPIQAS